MRAFVAISLLGLFLIGATPSLLLAHRGEAHPAPAPTTTYAGSDTAVAGGVDVDGKPIIHEIDWVYFWFDWQLVSLLLTAWILYYLGIGPLRERIAPNKPFPKRHLALFTTGVVLYYLSVSSSLDEIGEVYLFTAHMLQHNIIIYIIPLFLLLGIPVWLADAVLGSKFVKPIAGYFFSPLVAFVLFNLCFVVWHIPALYEWALRDKLVHDLEHTTFLLTAIMMWWPVFSPSRKAAPAIQHYGLQMLYIFALAVAQLPLFAYLCFADAPHYPTYAAAIRVTDMTPLDDQFVGGVLMKIFAMVAYVGVWAFIFFRWAREAQGDQEPLPVPVQYRI